MQGSFGYKIKKVLSEDHFSRYFWMVIGDAITKVTKRLDHAVGQLQRNRISRSATVNPKKIVFQTFQGDYTCNPKYICEELLRRGTDAEIVWAGREESICTPGAFPYGVKTVESYTYEMMQEMASAKIIITNSVEYQKRKLPVRPDQVVIQTFHGSLGIKRFDKGHNSGKAWVRAGEYNGQTARYIISNSTFEDEVYRSSFWTDTEILRYGHARNDILLQPMDDELKKRISRIKRNIGIPEDARVVLYGPTFRDAHNFDCYNIKPDVLFEALHDRFGGEWVLLNRYHPTVRDAGSAFRSSGEIINVTQYPDIQELMLIADVAITDYSSWIYDYMLTGKPGFIFATDIEKYNNERGFYFSLYDTPFPVATDPGTLADNVRVFDAQRYAAGCRVFLDEKGCIDDGHASERIVDKLIEILNGAE